VACATGDTDVIISVRARNIEELYNFVIEVLGNIPGVRRTQTFLLPLKIKNIATWMPPEVLEAGQDNS
jgi:DNA-binding Lrp family transcriptional regulator